ncbi:uncharacterized protein F5Z01DRAFT_141005 [Emericellopsis atlantica]|uniref:Ubiquitin-like domain-containing protein n=1 Tax=Emericellopsis atlantica TaxID=2614577 RepID=A0A9P7ZKS0_9HYPO|nr:uncharacterized protein F5Z01DRAFT_141005 [Emericellopsis atlantica]KAG9253502.1 hypothetical protein F5Z01DRAFT_141005 [Emericellopsis atlantica]
MGCCFSRSSGPNSPYPGGDLTTSAGAINPPPLTLPESAQSAARRGHAGANTASNHRSAGNQTLADNSRRHSRQQRPLDQHINKPLKPFSWISKDRLWTRRELAQERRDFFDTRVTGRAEIWQTIHAALQAMWEDPNGADGVALAQTILSAAEISLPTGSLANGVYDSLGNYYPLPQYIVCDPNNVSEDSDVKGELPTGVDDPQAEDISEDMEKDKHVVDVTPQVTLRARLSENARDYQIMISPSETSRSVARKIANKASLSADKSIRIAYMGKILKGGASLASQGWQEGHIVNALVFDHKA